jgi:hypothetical protein
MVAMTHLPFSERDLHYRHSGEWSPVALFAWAPVAGLAATFLAWLYARGLVDFVSQRLLPLLPLVFGAALGAVILCYVWVAKVRSPAIVVVLAAVVTTWAYYFHWAIWASSPEWVDLPPTVGPLDLALEPAWLLAVVAEAYEFGAWSFTGFRGAPGEPVTGPLLGLFWLLEAGMVFGTSLVVAQRGFATRPFCERCQRWHEKEKDIVRLWHADERVVLAVLRDRDLGRLDALQVVDRSRADTGYQCDLDVCPACGRVTLDLLWLESKVFLGMPYKSKTPRLRHLKLASAAADALRTIGGR